MQSPGLEQYAMRAFADALDCVPMALAQNSGLSPIETLASIKSRQVKEKNTRLGVDCMQTGSSGEFVLSPSYTSLSIFARRMQSSSFPEGCSHPLPHRPRERPRPPRMLQWRFQYAGSLGGPCHCDLRIRRFVFGPVGMVTLRPNHKHHNIPIID